MLTPVHRGEPTDGNLMFQTSGLTVSRVVWTNRRTRTRHRVKNSHFIKKQPGKTRRVAKVGNIWLCLADQMNRFGLRSVNVHRSDRSATAYRSGVCPLTGATHSEVIRLPEQRRRVEQSLRLSLILQDISPRLLHNSDLNLNQIWVHKERPGAALHIQKYNFPHALNAF